MPRQRPHVHRCIRCKALVECGGAYEQNLDGEPEIICPEYHLPGGAIAEVTCEACDEKIAAELAIERAGFGWGI